VSNNRNTAWGGTGGDGTATVVGSGPQGLPVVNARYYGIIAGNSDTSNASAMVTAVAAANSAGGGILFFEQGTYDFTSMSLAGMSNVRCIGTGIDTTLDFTTTTGTVVNMNNAAFCGFEDMLIRPKTSQKTAGEIFSLNGASTQRNTFRGLRMASCYKGWNFGTCTTTTIDDVQMLDFSASHSWHSLFHLSGAATSTVLTNIRGGTAAGISNTVLYVDGSTVDTVICDQWDLASQGGTSMGCVYLGAGEWFRMTNMSLEAGTTSNAFETAGAVKGVTLQNAHLLGFKGFVCNGGKVITFDGGEVVSCQREGVYAAALSTIKHLKIKSVVASDCGLATTNTYDGIYMTANVTDFDIQGCTSDDATLLGSTNRVRYGCNIDATCDRFTIQGNAFYGSTGKLNNAAGTSATKVATNNI